MGQFEMLNLLIRSSVGLGLLAAIFFIDECCYGQDAPALVADAANYQNIGLSFLKQHCLRCHGPEKQEAKFRIDQDLPNQFLDPLAAEKWGEVVNVVSSHTMPPEAEPQPSEDDAARLIDWITGQLARAEVAKRSSSVVMRRMNRAEYNNTIRDLFGVDFRPADKFPEDPPAGGFDNIGQALTVSPLQIELYYQAAMQTLDKAFVTGQQPPKILWRFDPEENTQGLDRYRVKRDGNNVLVNPGNNRLQDGWTTIHHQSWDTGIGFRDFALKHPGKYIIRVHACGVIPNREAIVESATKILAERRDAQIKKESKGEKWHNAAYDRDLEHFRTHRMYGYGPPRMKVTRNLGGQPMVIAEMDIDASAEKPKVYEIRAQFTTERAGLEFDYAYDIPRVLENAWMQNRPEFARPELKIDYIELEGPIHPVWPPVSHSRIFIDSPNKGNNETAYAQDVLRLFMRRAFRRPIAKEELDAKVALFSAVRPDKESFEEAIKVPLAAVLTSPHFLYLVEPSMQPDSKSKLNPHEYASRLSYFLWSSMPDEELMKMASQGKLADPSILRAQIDRMLTDPKSQALTQNFAGQWLGLRKVGANPPANNLYPEYDRHLEISIVQETEGFFDEILHQDLDLRNFIRSDFVTINERLARFYDIPGVQGDHIRAVKVPAGSNRGGLVTQASILSITSNGTRTSPVSRGVWILKTMLGTDPGLPVANAGEIAPKVPGVYKATVRQRLQIHRTLPLCARCHNKIDPLGFALENYNAAGEWRDREGFGYHGRIEKGDPMIDASSKMPDGTEISGVAGLQAELLRKETLFLTALTEKLFTYGLGRELGYADRPLVKQAVEHVQRNQYTLRSLIHFIVHSSEFQQK